MNIRTLGAFALLTFTVACDGEATPTEPDPEPTRTEDILALTGDAVAGETVYTNNCTGCHGADGTGVTGPDLTAYLPNATDEDFIDVVLNGQGVMGAFDSLADQDIADLTTYVTTTF